METTFFLDTPATAAVAKNHLLGDVQAAELSGAFRTYYRLRPLVPLRLRQLLQQSRKVEAGPRWCYPDAFLERLLAAIDSEPLPEPIIHPWPQGRRFALVLTHDVETEDGLRNAPAVAEIERRLGFRSSWNIVPYKYRIDKGILRDLESHGFEIGIHGYNHDGKLFFSKREFTRRAAAINRALAEYGAVGFRSPMVHRNLEWLQSLGVEYDASCFDADPYQAMPGGVGSIWPFVAGKFVELPYTLPQDHTLFIASGDQNGTLWHEKRDFIVRQHGMVLMLTHPDYLDSPRRLDAYRRFLVATREIGDYWHGLPPRGRRLVATPRSVVRGSNVRR